MTKIKRALLSVFDKSGIEDLARFLVENNVEIISSGGTLNYLEKSGIKTISIESITGFSEMLDGRVKTLHPKILAGILAKRNSKHLEQLKDNFINTIDLVVVNLYPFEKTITSEDCTLETAVEQIDIGGPTLLRSTAKNFNYTTVLCNPKQYDSFKHNYLENNKNTSLEYRKNCAIGVFQLVSQYDNVISNYLAKEKDENTYPQSVCFSGKKIQPLRYGENPHQKAAFYGFSDKKPLQNFEQLHGKELSYNNILDLSAALSLLSEFSETTCVILKHNNPCGAGVAETTKESFEKALQTDPLSAFGGIIGFNSMVDLESAELISASFFECIIAPAFSEEALSKLQKKKNLRLLVFDPNDKDDFGKDIRMVQNGFLIQDKDYKLFDGSQWKVVSKRKPSNEENKALKFAWKLAKHVRSNAIVFAKHDQLIAVGAGQMSRVDSADLAVLKAKNSGLSTQNTVVGSDAFFPFRDGIDSLAKAGATAVIQPGGSVRDEEVIKAANENNIAMVFTGMRHFKH